MELELKHILPYLDSGIKAIDLQAGPGDNIFEITGFSNTKGNIEIFDQYGNFDIKISDIKLILIPLSCLTKEELRQQGFWHHIDYLTHENKGVEWTLNAPFNMVQYLLSQHYDIYGGIGTWAIDKNTL